MEFIYFPLKSKKKKKGDEAPFTLTLVAEWSRPASQNLQYVGSSQVEADTWTCESIGVAQKHSAL
jgi:hypothetical protein